MEKKSGVIMILVDGMRPDAIKDRLHGFKGQRNARTVMPSVTLPCHMSLFLGVTPDRHGILTNTYVPQVRPIRGLIDVLNDAGKKCAMFYNWEQLRDISQPGSLNYSLMTSMHNDETDAYLADAAEKYISDSKPNFLFLYLGETDEEGHTYGWLSEEYMKTVNSACDHIERIASKFGDSYDIIVLADHGGHGRSHGTESDEDMTIPILIKTKKALQDDKIFCITDVADTVAELLGVAPNKDWEGKSLLA